MKPRIRQNGGRGKPRINGNGSGPTHWEAPGRVWTTKRYTPSDYTRYQVMMMRAYGIQYDIMAKILGISNDTLRKYYRHELDTGLDRANIVVASQLYKTAISGGKDSVKAQIFWLSTRHKEAFKETTAHELTGPDGKPIQTESILTDEERAIRLLQIINSSPTGAIGSVIGERNGRVGALAGPTDDGVSE